MLLRYLHRDKLAVPAAMSFVVIGLLMVVVALAAPHLFAAQASKNTFDFARGFLIGLAIALEIVGISALVPALAAARDKQRRPGA